MAYLQRIKCAKHHYHLYEKTQLPETVLLLTPHSYHHAGYNRNVNQSGF
jgi:hypothetical protein